MGAPPADLVTLGQEDLHPLPARSAGPVVRVIGGLLAWWGRIGPRLPLGAVEIGPYHLHPLALLFVLSGSLMIIKTLRIPKP